MRRLLGPHLGGRWTHKLELLRQWQPPFVLVLEPEVEKVAQLREACPRAIITGRFYHEDGHYASNIAARPKEFAREIHQEIKGNPVTPLLDYVQSNNEVCQDWQGIQKLNEFTLEWMALADQSGAYKCAILAFSVGNPDMPHKPGDPAGFDGRMLYWQQVLPSLNYAQRNSHILLLHAYGYPNMFAPDADWFIYRYERQVQANLRTLGITNLQYAYGEIGIDRLIVNGKGGYKVVTNDQDYVNQLLQWERDLQGQSLLLGGAIFTFGDSGGWDTYDIADTTVASRIAAHYTKHANEYESSPKEETDTMPESVFLPSVPNQSTPTVPPPALPPYPDDWDPRLTERGVKIERVLPGAPGTLSWRVTKGVWLDEQQSQGRHHFYADVYADDQPVIGAILAARWPGDGYATFEAEAKPLTEPMANFPMSKSLNEFSFQVNEPKHPSDVVTGVGMGANGNSGIHTSTYIEWTLYRTPQAQPTPPVEEPDTPPTPPSKPAGDNWQRSRAFVKKWEGGWADDPNDPGGATNKGITLGTYKRWREVQGQPEPTKDDLRAISDAEVDEIYHRWYWQASGADRLLWPLALAQFDTAVNAGVGKAQEMLQKSNGNFLAYMSYLIDWYTRIDNFEHFGRAWIRRRAEILLEASK